MFRHPRYLEIPWAIHWEQKAGQRHYLLLTVILILMALFLIGVGVISGLT